MDWIGWACAVAFAGVAFALWRTLAVERARRGDLLYAKIDAENALEHLRENQQRVVGAARQAALGEVCTELAAHLQTRLGAARGELDAAAAGLADYRARVHAFDAAVQYCLQPVELILGADKASLDRLVGHVEGARRKLFDARAALEKHPLHRDADALDDAAGTLRELEELARSVRGFAAAPAEPPQRIDVNACLDDALRVLAPRVGMRLRIVRDYRDVPPVQAPAAELRAALLRLLDNAARAIEAHGTLTVATRAADAGLVEIAVTDTGAGIADDLLPHVFEPFFTTRAAAGAAGLGLALVREFAEARGGSIAVRTTRGHGSTFTLALPAEVRAAAPAAAPVGAAPPRPGWVATAH